MLVAFVPSPIHDLTRLRFITEAFELAIRYLEGLIILVFVVAPSKRVIC
jgi:hypothetical protein